MPGPVGRHAAIKLVLVKIKYVRYVHSGPERPQVNRISRMFGSNGLSTHYEGQTGEIGPSVAVEKGEPAVGGCGYSLNARVVRVAQTLARPVMALELPRAALLPMLRLPVRHVLELHEKK